MRGRPRKGDIPVDEHTTAVQMYQDQWYSLKDIAHSYNVTPYVLRILLVDMNVEIRSRGRKLKMTPIEKYIEAAQPANPNRGNLGEALNRVERAHKEYYGEEDDH